MESTWCMFFLFPHVKTSSLKKNKKTKKKTEKDISKSRLNYFNIKKEISGTHALDNKWLVCDCHDRNVYKRISHKYIFVKTTKQQNLNTIFHGNQISRLKY